MIDLLNIVAALLTIAFGLFGFLAPRYTASALDLAPTDSTPPAPLLNSNTCNRSSPPSKKRYRSSLRGLEGLAEALAGVPDAITAPKLTVCLGFLELAI